MKTLVLRPASLPLLSPIYFRLKVSWGPFAYDSRSDGPISSSRRCHLLCSILARACAIFDGGAHVHKGCRANLAKELSGLSSARRTRAVLGAHLRRDAPLGHGHEAGHSIPQD